ncbi:hypothetical protein BH11BAC6_BH11BAC6_14520 [soil metagenome]
MKKITLSILLTAAVFSCYAQLKDTGYSENKENGVV